MKIQQILLVLLIVHVTMDILDNFAKLVSFLNLIIIGYFFLIEYFRCRSNGRFADQYNCANGKYFECIYYEQGMNVDFIVRIYF